MNSLKTAVLLGALTGLLVLIGGYVGGQNGMLIAFLFAMGMNFFSYWFSDRIVLRMYRAQEVTPQQAPELHRLVQDLAMKAGLPMPRVYIIPGDTPNAFATGRNEKHAVVAVTEGILRILSREELEGVIGHELSHIKNRDILIGSIAATIAGAITMLANMAQWAAIFGGARGDDDEGGGMIGMLAMAILAPVAAMLIQMAISRSREYLADDGGARVSGKPWALASALEKLQAASRAIPMNANPSTAHIFTVSPLSGRSFASLFSTHPPIEERIARLRSMQPRM
ncbi:MAG: zinc metalloprotease HtpX [Pseudomonadota bacterium]|jgi:heat shock protein HtpX|nr:zinc metalloprotease HtpX [Syntrophaceae bacterium]MBP7033317.1 zinc metalloprotease HtpX [Syntrophobacterales bacterium]MDI9556032.1 zinc metalloprotease HtpX [Pseudomonadota bacterium]NLX30314.1 zinc metalloprotease HtpX [Deltaproteobacteria bacterium]HNU84860.1 zinc metalloprotease HtpX [Syntrophales bacterium]